MNKVSLGWAEDNKQFVSHVKRLVLAHEYLFDLRFVADNGESLLSHLEYDQPEIVLMDIRVPKLNGIEAAKVIHSKFHTIKVIALTEFDFEENIIAMSKAGVKSFLSKNEVNELARVIKIVHEGGVYYPDEVGSIVQTI